MRRWMMVVVVISLLVLGSTGVMAEGIVKIGVTQIVEHPALDAARDGFIEGLAELGYQKGKDVVYDVQSAQGDMSIAQTIAQKFVSDRVNLILAIATPTAQAAANVTQDIPILITAVTDPVAAGLVESIDRPGTNVTGTSDLTPVAKQLELLTTISRKAKRVGIIYNPGETNSIVQVDLAKAAAKALGLRLIEATAANSGSVFQAAQSLVGRVDAIYVPTDNTAASAIESVVMVAEEAKLPLIAGENSLVRRGALATVSIDYYELGRQTAKLAARVLAGESAAQIPIEYQATQSLVVNLAAATAMGVDLPESVVNEAVEVIK